MIPMKLKQLALMNISLVIIEWANYIEELIPEEYIHIKIEKLPDMGENFRKISINGYGDRYNYIKEIKEC